jgi:hypothetical protein
MGCFSVAGRPSRSATGAAAAGPAAATHGKVALLPLTDRPALEKPAGGEQMRAVRVNNAANQASKGANEVERSGKSDSYAASTGGARRRRLGNASGNEPLRRRQGKSHPRRRGGSRPFSAVAVREWGRAAEARVPRGVSRVGVGEVCLPLYNLYIEFFYRYLGKFS